ncbi:hypothetical protein BMS3Abin10_01845 [bacterium BMS3Abin10]|nr:hypothetical protein BMS3Abin10_01845 [bacterium BMS3Abin10]
MKKIFFVIGALFSGLGFLLSGCGGTLGNPMQKITIADAGAYAVECPGSTVREYVNVGHGQDMADISEFTVEAWIKTSKGGTIFSRFKKAFLYVDSSDNLAKFGIDNETQVVSSFTPVNDGSWRHVAGVLVDGLHQHPDTTGIGGTCDNAAASGTHLDMYVDGVWEDCAPTAFPVDIDCSDCVNTICRHLGTVVPGPDRIYNGVVDEVRLWKEARSPEQIKKWMRTEISGTDWDTADPGMLNIIGYWKFNEGKGAVATDSSGYGHTGTKLKCDDPDTCNVAGQEKSTPWTGGWVDGYSFLY